MKVIPQTKDIIEEFCTEYGYDFELVKNMYFHYTGEILEKVRRNPEVVEIPIKYLGVFHTTIYNEKYYQNKEIQKKNYDIAEFHKEREKSVQQVIDERFVRADGSIKECPFLNKRRPLHKIKNK